MDRIALGLRIRALRIRAALRQSDLALAAGVPRRTIGELENGAFAHVSVDQLVRVGASLRATVDVRIRWHGEDLDRLIDAAHAATVAAVLERLRAWKWEALVEVSFAIWGERGSIDILAFHPPTGSLLVIELKTDLVDLSGLLTAVDRYRRLAPQLAERLGWNVRTVSTWVVFRDSATNRRRVAEHAGVLRTAFPLNGNQMRSWLAKPSGAVAGLSFIAIGASGRRGTGVRRVRVRRDGAQSIRSAVGDS